MRKLLVVMLVGALVACVTPYGPRGLAGGYAELQLAENVWQVSFQGNGYTSRELVQTYLLRRCAELAAAAGQPYFRIVTGDEESRTSAIVLPGQSSGSATVVGDSVYWQGRSTPSTVVPVQKHGSNVVIELLAERPTDGLVYEAGVILRNFGGASP